MKLEQVYSVKKVAAPHPIEVEVPGSKSITNRALLLAALADGTSRLKGVLFSDDSRHFLAALQDLGFHVEVDEDQRQVVITGMGGRIPKKCARIDVGSAGTAARFLTAFLALSEGEYQLNSSEQMKKRPMQELIESLEQLGAFFSFEEEVYHFPFRVSGRRNGIDFVTARTANDRLQDEKNTAEESIQWEKTGAVSCRETTVDVEKSSQFLSALLIASVLFDQDFVIHVEGSHGMAYVEMTVQMMEQFGLTIEKTPDGYRIPAAAAYQAREYQIEPDMSAACYFYAAGAILGVSAKVRNVHFKSLQGDVQFLQVLSDMGCILLEESDGIRLFPWDRTADSADGKGTRTKETGELQCRLHIPDDRRAGWDLSSFSDQALTLAAIAPFADAPVVIRGIGHIRFQECDRIQAILTNLNAMGIGCEEKDGVISICPEKIVQTVHESEALSHTHSSTHIGKKPHGARIVTYEDHRVAMAFTIPGLLIGNQVIENPVCCRKTFEDFFEVLEAGVY